MATIECSETPGPDETPEPLLLQARQPIDRTPAGPSDTRLQAEPPTDGRVERPGASDQDTAHDCKEITPAEARLLGHNELAALYRCQSGEAQFNLYRAMQPAERQMPTEVARCVWSGVRPFATADLARGSQGMEQIRRAAVGMEGVAAHCLDDAADHTVVSAAGPAGQGGRRLELACLVVQAGGPAQFMSLMLSDGLAAQQAAKSTLNACPK